MIKSSPTVHNFLAVVKSFDANIGIIGNLGIKYKKLLGCFKNSSHVEIFIGNYFSGGSGISQTGAANPKGGDDELTYVNFPQKLHKTEKKN